MVNKTRLCIVMIVALIFAEGCTKGNRPAMTESPTAETHEAMPSTTPGSPELIEAGAHQSTTQNDLTGNHVATGSIDILTASVIDVPLEGEPIWLVGSPLNDGVVFVAVMGDGTAQAFKVAGQSYSPVEITPSQLPAGMPPLLMVSNGMPKLVIPPVDSSQLTNPILLDGRSVYIESNGDLVLDNVRLPVNALPDSRILMNEEGHLLVLCEPSIRYDHGVVGDELEASAIAIVETKPELSLIRTIEIKEPDVIEGISAIWADINNDGNRDIIVTLSNNQTGARIAAFNTDGSLLAESDSIGLGYRWRHQLAVAQFEANQRPLLVSVRTPHIGGIVEFFRYIEGRLEIVKEFIGFSTHSIGSRNLDSALAADLNNDGIFELLAPEQSHASLGIISFNGVSGTMPLNGVLTSNLSAVNFDGKLYIGAGTQDKIRIWIP